VLCEPILTAQELDGLAIDDYGASLSFAVLAFAILGCRLGGEPFSAQSLLRISDNLSVLRLDSSFVRTGSHGLQAGGQPARW